MPDDDPLIAPVPESRTVEKKKTRLSLVWLVPIVAAVIGAWVAVTSILGAGPKITIVFQSAEGLEAGKTKIHFNGVDVGMLVTIRLTEDHLRVIATAQMAPKTEEFLVEGTKFWVVRPRISGATVSGLGTLISGAYVGMEIGRSQTAKREFVALDTEPVVTGDISGRFFLLKTPDLGSLGPGRPIYLRRLQVGEVVSYELDKDGNSLTVEVFVRAPYDQYVTPATRFWHESGIDVSISAAGLSVRTASVLSLLVGGIVFETPQTGPVLSEADSRAVFPLFSDRAAAFALPEQDPANFVLVFKQSVGGLAPGAPVEFKGIPIGQVTEIRAQMDMETAEFSVPVTVNVDAAKLGVKFINARPGEDRAAARRRMIDLLVSRGLRVQLRTANMLTGALLVAVDFFPDAPPVTIDWTQNPVQLPTAPGSFEGIEASLTRIVKKLDALPYEAIGNDLTRALESLDQTLTSARSAVGNVDELTKPNSALSGELSKTLQDVARAARDLGVLLDYLERHPEGLIRGKTGENK